MVGQTGPAWPDEPMFTGAPHAVRQVEFMLSNKIYDRSNPVRRKQAVRSARRILGVLERLEIYHETTRDGVAINGSSAGFAPRKIIASAPHDVFSSYASAIAESLGIWYRCVNGNPPYRAARRDSE